MIPPTHRASENRSRKPRASGDDPDYTMTSTEIIS